MAAGSQPLAFAELAFGGLLITSAITGESVGELLTNGLTKAGKERLHAKGQVAGSSFSGAGLSGEGEPGTAGAPGSLAVSPSVAGSRAGKHPNHEQRLRELKHGLEVALHYKGVLGEEVTEGRKSKKQAEREFNEKFPWYATWAKEAKELLGG